MVKNGLDIIMGIVDLAEPTIDADQARNKFAGEGLDEIQANPNGPFPVAIQRLEDLEDALTRLIDAVTKLRKSLA